MDNPEEEPEPLLSRRPSKITTAPGSRRSSKSRFAYSEEVEESNDAEKALVEVQPKGSVRRPQLLPTYAREQSVPIDMAKQALRIFYQFADLRESIAEEGFSLEAIQTGKPFKMGDIGYMHTEKFGQACCAIAGVSNLKELPDGFLESAMLSADKDLSGRIDLCEFMHFYFKFSFSEEVTISPENRMLRKIARKHGIQYTDMDKYLKAFTKVDEDGSGLIELDEFAKLIPTLLKLPAGQILPESRVKKLWVDANRDNSNAAGMNLDIFTGYCSRFFADDNPLETFYKNVRPV
ncbi:unnamed protein product [Polarella glacialis]|uniref:EF-hand domain-containing protein n=3 Tax=Polarella glacialis TaxID=89957 RepID=A0A813GPI3_POLGL|nr:unnamed protein product [Polarella glacialis]